jgi:hypothetical protein
MWLNLSGTLNVFRLIKDPTLCLPQYTASTFNHLPIPLSKAFSKKTGKDGEKDVDIRAVVLDKDNCFAIPHTDEIHKPYKVGQFSGRRDVITIDSSFNAPTLVPDHPVEHGSYILLHRHCSERYFIYSSMRLWFDTLS